MSTYLTQVDTNIVLLALKSYQNRELQTCYWPFSIFYGRNCFIKRTPARSWSRQAGTTSWPTWPSRATRISGSSGFPSCGRVNRNPRTNYVVIIFSSSKDV
jgi:hypothetical protein